MTLNQYFESVREDQPKSIRARKPTREENLQSPLGTWYIEIGDLELEDLTEYDLGTLIQQRMALSLIIPEVVKRLNIHNRDADELLEFISNNVSSFRELDDKCIEGFVAGLEVYCDKLSDLNFDPFWEDEKAKVRSVISVLKRRRD